MTTGDTLYRIIRYAASAPSGHNTQPWKFIPSKERITIIPDFTRSLPVVDSDNHALHISLGCALENLIVAANHYNYETAVIINQDSGTASIEVTLGKVAETEKTGLFEYLLKRQVTRNRYSEQEVDEKILERITEGCSGDMVKMMIFKTENEIATLTPYIIDGSDLQFNNRKFVDELVSWCRFSEKEAMKRGDGIWSSSMGLPAMGRTLGSFIMKNMVSASSEAKRWEKLIARTAGFVMFMTDQDNPSGWIRLGQYYQRFALQATRYNISHAHVNMPCEEPEVRNRLIGDFGLGEMVPMLLIRYGYSRPLPYSFRRNLNEIIIES